MNAPSGILPIAVGSTIRRLSVKVGSRPVVQGCWRRAEAGPVGVLTRGGGDARRQRMRPTLCQGLSPQKGPSEDGNAKCI